MACPFLGLLRDPTTYHAYPSAGNCCGRVDPPALLPGSYQSRFCLSARHTECPLASPSWRGAFPEALRASAEREWGRPTGQPRRRRWVWIALTAVLVVIAGAAVWLVWGLAPPSPSMPDVSAAALSSREPTGIASATPFPPPTATATATTPPTATGTPTPVPATAGPALETPFGPEAAFLIHSVQQGESLFSLGQTYGSSAEVIAAANGLEDQSLWPGQLVVIPVAIDDPAAVPRFVIYRVVDAGEALPEVAARYGADPEEIRRYNALGENPWLPGGRLLILPQP